MQESPKIIRNEQDQSDLYWNRWEWVKRIVFLSVVGWFYRLVAKNWNPGVTSTHSSLPGIINFLFSIKGKRTDIYKKELGQWNRNNWDNVKYFKLKQKRWKKQIDIMPKHHIQGQLLDPTTSRGAWSMSSSRIHWPLVTACVSVPGCHTNFPGMSVQRYMPSSICETCPAFRVLLMLRGTGENLRTPESPIQEIKKLPNKCHLAVSLIPKLDLQDLSRLNVSCGGSQKLDQRGFATANWTLQ